MPQQDMKLSIRPEGLSMIATSKEPVVRRRAAGKVPADQDDVQLVLGDMKGVLGGEVHPGTAAVSGLSESKGLERGKVMAARGLAAPECEIDGLRDFAPGAEAFGPAEVLARLRGSGGESA